MYLHFDEKFLEGFIEALTVRNRKDEENKMADFEGMFGEANDDDDDE